jgi:AAA+ superfamily predicted ATPase
MKVPAPVALQQPIQRLDALIAHAIARSADDGRDPDVPERLRGLLVDRAEVERLLERPAGAPLLAGAGGRRPDGELGELASRFGLTAFDVDVLVLALAPEIDLRYERICAYLHDDVTRRRPSVDLALNLLSADTVDKAVKRSRFAPGAPLQGLGLLSLSDRDGRGLLARELVPDGVLLAWLGGDGRIDGRIDGRASLTWSPRPASGSLAAVAAALAPAPFGAANRILAVGPRGSGRGRVAEAFAHAADRPMLRIDVEDEPAALGIAIRQATLHDAVLCVEGVGREAERVARTILGALREFRGDVVLCDERPSLAPALTVEIHGDGYLPVAAPGAEPDARREAWARELTAAGSVASAADVARLADRFRFTPPEIRAAVRSATSKARLDEALTGEPAAPRLEDVAQAARTQTGHELAALATRITPSATWNQLVLADDALDQLRELCNRAALRGRVFGEWGFGSRLGGVVGLTALFAGASGTGKTMAASVIATELGLDLYRIDLAGVVSKYIGETEKNLGRVFDAARRTDGILLFDEADALFGKRSEVRDAHDRYANIEVAYLLQRMEEHDGVAILATNLSEHLDASFARRLAFSVHFPFPDTIARSLIWRTIWPHETPLAPDLDLDAVAERYPLSGGGIRNVALAAAFAAAADGTAVGRRHIDLAARREGQKLGELDAGAFTPPPVDGLVGAPR